MDLMWNGNIEHIAEHGLTQDDVQHVFDNPTGYGVSRSSGEPAVFGYTPDGRYIIVVYCEIDESLHIQSRPLKSRSHNDDD